MPESNTAVIRGIYDAFGAGDGAGALGRMSPDIVWNEAENNPWADGNPYIGPESVARGIFARCASEWDGFSITVEELIGAGDKVVMLGRYGGRCKATGKTQNTQAVHVWTVQDGLAVRFQQYADTLQISLVMGLV